MLKNRSMRCVIFLALYSSTALVSPAQANEDERPDEAGDIVVTAQRRSETLERTPVAVSVISGDALVARVIVSESDLQFATPGLTVKAGQDSNSLNYSLRGQTLDAYTTSRSSVLPYFNEVQVGSLGASSFYDLESVQVLKGPQGTLFGRNSTGGAVLFTSAKPKDEFGGYVTGRIGNYSLYYAEGALNVPLVTEKILLRVAGSFQRRNGFQYNLFYDERVGDVERENLRVSLTLKPTDAIENNLVVSFGHASGSNTASVLSAVMPSATPTAFVNSQLFYSPAIDNIFGAGTWANYLARNPKVNPDGLTAELAAQQARGPFVINQDAANFLRNRTTVISNITTFDVADDIQVKNVFGYVQQKQNEAGEFDGSPFGIDSTGTPGLKGGDIGRRSRIRQISEELQLNGKAFGRQLSYVAGLFFSDEVTRMRNTSAVLCMEGVPGLSCESQPYLQRQAGKTTSRTYAGYGQGTLDLTELTGLGGLSITAGVRYSSEKVSHIHTEDDVSVVNPDPSFLLGGQSKTFNKWSWQIGLEEQVTNNLLLYVKTRRSFRSGGFNFYAPPLPGTGGEGGSEFLPEQATDVEVGAKFRGDVGGAPVRINLAGYDMKIKNIQRGTYVVVPVGPGSLAGLTVNVPTSKVTGFELDGSISPTSWLTLGGALNYTDARFTDPTVVVYSGSTQLGAPVNFGPYPDTPKWTGSAYAQINASLPNDLEGNLRGEFYSQSKSYYSSTHNTLNPFTDINGYSLVNVSAGIESPKTGWAASVILKNVFNKTYYVGGLPFYSLFGINTKVPGDPRTVMVQVTKKF